MSSSLNEFKFPYKPYTRQIELMKEIEKVLKEGKIGILESPTGTGKSLCILCGSLKWLKNVSIYPQPSEYCEKKDDKKDEDPFSWITESCRENEIETEEGIIRNEIKELKKRYESQRKNTHKKNNPNLFKKRKIVLEEENGDDEEDSEEFDSEDESSTNELEKYAKSVLEEIEEVEKDPYKPKHCNKIYYCSRTHSQLSQIIDEINKTEYKGKCRIVTLGSRQKLCINKELLKKTSPNDLNEKCKELNEKEEKNKCPYFGVDKFQKLSDIILNETKDIEDLRVLGEELGYCPYYSVRYSIPLAEIVLLPYSVLLHKETRESLGIDIANQSIILDEGHNVVNTINELYSPSITIKDIQCLKKNIREYEKKYAMKCNIERLSTIESVCKLLFIYFNNLDNNFNQLFRVTDFKSVSKISDINFSEINSYIRKYNVAAKMRTFILRRSKEMNEEEREKNESIIIPNALYKFVQFTESLVVDDSFGRICVSKQNSNIASLQYILLSPSEKFQPVVEKARSIILIGGTLEPIDELKYQLFPKVEKEDRIEVMKLDHIINPSQIICMILSKSVNNQNELIFNYEKKEYMYKYLSDCLLGIIQNVPFGMICFFTSYSYLQKFIDFIKRENIVDSIQKYKRIFYESKDILSSSNDYSVFDKYKESIENNEPAILLCVIGGKLSEGINFNDNLARNVTIIGMPYPNPNDPVLKERKKNYEIDVGDYETNICMKAVNQSIGRSIRHINDYSSIVLIDSRYDNERIVKKLPQWIQRSLKKYYPNKYSIDYGNCIIELKQFYQNN